MEKVSIFFQNIHGYHIENIFLSKKLLENLQKTREYETIFW